MEPSTWLQAASAAVWLCARVPQTVEIHKCGRAGVSLAFLLSWTLADVALLAGPARLVFVCHCAFDVLVLMQFHWLGERGKAESGPVRRGSTGRCNRFDEPIHSERPRLLLRPRERYKFFAVLASSFGAARGESGGGASGGGASKGGVRGAVDPALFLSPSLHILARLCQLVYTVRHKDTAGLSPWLFAMTMLGNTLYLAALGAPRDLQYIPHFVLVMLDFVLLCACWHYKLAPAPETAPLFTTPTWYHNYDAKDSRPPLRTLMIPSIVENFGTVQKKAHSRIPFSPIDFLHDEYAQRTLSRAHSFSHSQAPPPVNDSWRLS